MYFDKIMGCLIDIGKERKVILAGNLDFLSESESSARIQRRASQRSSYASGMQVIMLHNK